MIGRTWTAAAAAAMRFRAAAPAALAGLLALAAAIAPPAPLAAQEQEREQPEYAARGTVADSLGEGLRNAMVVALARPDSVLAGYSLTNGDGNFEIEGLAPGGYILQVTLMGYATVRRDFEVAAADVDAGEVEMSVMAIAMDSLVVSIEHVPFVVSRDTLSYNALAFQARPNASVEDLLRLLPGIEVGDDGSITAQGEAVENVLVDGKEFFGGDPTVATRNLPADAVKQVDVYDKQSDMAEFTGIPDGEEERTIDLKLKEEARTGHFGRAAGGVGGDVNNPARLASGAGNEARYEGSLNVNRFSPNVQLALTARANNVNQAGFSWGDYGDIAFEMAAMGGGDMRIGGGGGSSDGFTETMSAGLNASRDFGEDSWIRSSYFLSSLDNLQDRTVQQQALLGSRAGSLVDQSSNQEAGNLSHRVNLNGQVAFSEGHQLRVRVNGSAEASSLNSFANRVTSALGGGMLNSARTDYAVDGDELGGNGLLTWRKRLNEDGRSLVAEFRSSLDDSDMTADLQSLVAGGREAGEPQEILQEQTRDGRTFTNSLRMSLTQPIGGESSLEVFARRNSLREDRDNSVHDLIGGERVLNERMSTGFERAYTYLQGGARASRFTERSWVAVGLQLQRSQLDGKILDRDQTIENGYTHLLANAQFKTEIGERNNLNFRYRGSSREPSLTQLQPYADNSDPVNIHVGNPDLRPEYVHRINADYRFFDQFTFVSFATYGGFTFSRNAIAQSRTFDDRGFQTRMPVNTGGAWSADLGTNFDAPVRKLGVDVGLEYRASYSEGTELVNLAANDSRILRNTVALGVDNRMKDRFDVSASASFSFNDVRYSLNRELDRDYMTSQYQAEGELYLGAWTLNSTFRYRTFDRELFGGVDNIARWDATISRRVLDDRAEIELRAYDLLNQNQGVAVTNSAHAIQESRTESLGQYFMLRASYRLGNRMGGGAGGRLRK